MGFGSMWHWIVILAVIVLLFGGKKIPELAKGLGKGIKSFKEEMNDNEPKKVAADEQETKSIEASEKKEA